MINLKYQQSKENLMELFQVIREQRFGELSSTEKNLLGMMKDLKAIKPVFPTNPMDMTAWESRMDVYNELMENLQTIRSKTIKPKGVLVAEVFNGEVVVGFALCNFNYFDWNKTNKDVLKEIAKGRAYTWQNKTLDEVLKSIPESVYGEVYAFCQRAERYFKEVKLANWVADFLDIEQEEMPKVTYSYNFKDAMDRIPGEWKIVDTGWQQGNTQAMADALGAVFNSLFSNIEEGQGC